MSIARAEQLKTELTDRFVVVADGVPELKRFSGLTGKVRTVNMNCRALVEFDGPVDIGWYDIDPSYLKVVTEPLKKAAPAEKHAKPAATAAPKAAAPAKPAGKSPLELARAQGAGGAAPAASGEKKLSPLELARQQGAGKAIGDAPKAAAPSAEGGKKLSPLELARQQGAQKAETQASAAAPAQPASAAAPAAAKPAAPAPAASDGPKPTSTADILASLRKQDAGRKGS
jgi:hypothetical protein